MSNDGTDTPEGPAPVLAVLRVRVDLTQDEATSMVLRARLFAGIQYISQQLTGTDPLQLDGNNWSLMLRGADGPELARKSFDAAKLLRERILVDLSLPSHIGVHAAVIGNDEALLDQALKHCEQLQGHAPENAIAVSPEVFRVLEGEVQEQLSPPAPLHGDTLPAALFPPKASAHGELLREELLRNLTSPSVRRLHYVGFRLQKKEPPSLDIFDVFVMPSVEVRRRSTPSIEALAGLSSDLLRQTGIDSPLGQLTGSVQQATTYLAPQRTTFQEAFQRHPSLVILGDPGSGKTTLMRWLAVVGAGGPLAMHAALGSTAPALPLLISVGHLAQIRAALGGETSVVEALAHLFHQRGIASDEAGLRRFLERSLDQGECLVLLDGLDEVRSEARADLMRWLEDFAARYPRNRFIASARQVGYVGLALPGAVEVELGPFEDDQVRRYVHSFHRAYRQWEEGVPDDIAADQEAERLLTALFANQRLHELSRNPFILASLALIHRAEGQLPRHRVQAYEIFARTLCETWGQARRLTASTGDEAQIRYEEEAVPVLGRLALEMHRQWPNGVAPEDFVIATLATALRERDGISDEEAERSAREFLHRAGKDVQILMERGPQRWGFLHLTFQEFFAAVGLHASESFVDEAMAHLFDPRWQEILRLGVGYMALVQKRPEGARRFIQKVLGHQETGVRRVLTETLKKQVPLAALLASEAGDALPVSLQNQIAEDFCLWLCSMPRLIGGPILEEIRLSEFASRFTPYLERMTQGEELSRRANAIEFSAELNPDQLLQFINLARSDDAANVKAVAVHLSRKVPRDQAIAILEALLTDTSSFVQLGAAIELIVQYPDHRRKTVDIILAHENLVLAFFVVAALSRMEGAGELAEEIIQSWEKSNDPDSLSFASLIREMPATFPSSQPRMHSPGGLLKMLDSPQQAVRQSAMLALNNSKTLEALGPLRQLTLSSDPLDSESAMTAIWNIANATGLHSLPPDSLESKNPLLADEE
ncbi:NACHT domain-containing protein [Corallococcus praedator]|uniref:NACHT domain-containing protein n=1 Tax=Corallococcus praedator TaxID=2316724 RepID=A0ABX9QED2_9BACT|nr:MULTISPECIES: NACHT domain-containing protein [Corallococcus]RKH27774.1 NACHT domain-containing protein [Corallococcus sp. CA031C]RKI05708.1 NACHT domain-containing protein [Corallococcus praedator]